MVFDDANAMYGIQLEGLIGYRSDVKQLYYRDHITWRTIRVSTQCNDSSLTFAWRDTSSDKKSDFLENNL